MGKKLTLTFITLLICITHYSASAGDSICNNYSGDAKLECEALLNYCNSPVPNENFVNQACIVSDNLPSELCTGGDNECSDNPRLFTCPDQDAFSLRDLLTAVTRSGNGAYFFKDFCKVNEDGDREIILPQNTTIELKEPLPSVITKKGEVLKIIGSTDADGNPNSVITISDEVDYPVYSCTMHIGIDETAVYSMAIAEKYSDPGAIVDMYKENMTGDGIILKNILFKEAPGIALCIRSNNVVVENNRFEDNVQAINAGAIKNTNPNVEKLFLNKNTFENNSNGALIFLKGTNENISIPTAISVMPEVSNKPEEVFIKGTVPVDVNSVDVFIAETTVKPKWKEPVGITFLKSFEASDGQFNGTLDDVLVKSMADNAEDIYLTFQAHIVESDTFGTSSKYSEEVVHPEMIPSIANLPQITSPAIPLMPISPNLVYDTDGDGIPDANDACPLEAPNIDEDHDGCEDEVVLVPPDIIQPPNPTPPVDGPDGNPPNDIINIPADNNSDSSGGSSGGCSLIPTASRRK